MGGGKRGCGVGWVGRGWGWYIWLDCSDAHVRCSYKVRLNFRDDLIHFFFNFSIKHIC